MRCPLCSHKENGEIAAAAWTCPTCGSLAEDRELAWFLQQYNPLKDGAKVLDVGPSRARLQLAKKLFPSVRYTAIDPVPRGDNAGLKPPHRFLPMDVTRLSFSEQAFDAILCQHVLAEVRSDYMAMWEIHRCLRNEGFAVLTEPLFAGKTARFSEWKGQTVPASCQERPLAWAYGEDFMERLEAAGFFVHRLDLKVLAGSAATENAFRPDPELILGFKFRASLRAFLEGIL